MSGLRAQGRTLALAVGCAATSLSASGLTPIEQQIVRAVEQRRGQAVDQLARSLNIARPSPGGRRC